MHIDCFGVTVPASTPSSSEVGNRCNIASDTVMHLELGFQGLGGQTSPISIVGAKLYGRKLITKWV